MQLSYLSLATFIIIILVSIAFYFFANNVYLALIFTMSWFADLIELARLLIQGKSDQIFEAYSGYGFVVIPVKFSIGLANIYLILLHSYFKKWWAGALTILGGLIWLIVGYLHFSMAIV